MRIEVTGSGVRLSDALRARVVRRVLLALSRFGPRVRKVSVYLSEPANPLGGIDQKCRMRARLQKGDDLHASAINGGFDAAAARSAVQLAKLVGLATTPELGPAAAGASPRACGPRGSSPARRRRS